MPLGSNSDVLAAAALAYDDARLADAITDLFLPDEARLEERLRLASRALLTEIVTAIEADLRRHGARLLAGLGDEAAAAKLLESDEVLPSLMRAGVLRDADLMNELIAELRAAAIAERLPVDWTGDDDGDGNGGAGPSLMVRLAESSDGLVASAARAMLAVRSRRPLGARDLPAEVQHRLTWWIAAALRPAGGNDAAIDRALAGAAQRSLLLADEGNRPAAIAARLAAALDPTPAELPDLLVEALGDRQLGLFTALLARAAGLDGETARAVVLDPAGDRLWCALRLVGLGRDQIARIGWSLAEADPRRQVEAFAGLLDAIVAIDPSAAGAALHPFMLPRDYRRAIAAIGRSLA